jgi:hypothetical protein
VKPQQKKGTQLALKARKASKKTPQLTVIHRTYGDGQLVEQRETPSGNSMLAVRFPDGVTRILLAAPEFWVTLPDLGAIPVAKTVKPERDEADDDRAGDG